jgi:hypothetical protein
MELLGYQRTGTDMCSKKDKSDKAIYDYGQLVKIFGHPNFCADSTIGSICGIFYHPTAANAYVDEWHYLVEIGDGCTIETTADHLLAVPE